MSIKSEASKHTANSWRDNLWGIAVLDLGGVDVQGEGHMGVTCTPEKKMHLPNMSYQSHIDLSSIKPIAGELATALEANLAYNTIFYPLVPREL